MPHVFHPSSNAIARGSILALVVLISYGTWAAWAFQNSAYVSKQTVTVEQPVPFSHEHHAGRLGIDCRYCHTTVNQSQFASVPATKVCMSCHSQLWTGAQVLQPVRDSWQMNKPIQWVRVHNVPQYVLFPHDIHVAKGVGCSECHGHVDQMPLVWQSSSLQMQWCLDCHRHPEDHLRPRSEIFNQAWEKPPDQKALGLELVRDYHVKSERELTNCSTCHY